MKVLLEKEALESRLGALKKREAILIFLAGFLIINIFWNVIFERPLRHKIEALENQKQNVGSLLETQKQNLSAVKTLINSSSFVRNLQRQKQLHSQFRQAGEQLQNLQQTFVPPEAMARVTSDVIAQQAEVVLVSLKTFSEEPWLKSQAIKQEGSGLQDVNQHKMELTFRGTYFNTIAFLEHLEKLSWHLYWDRLEYQVVNYPDAKVVARFYVLSKQKD